MMFKWLSCLCLEKLKLVSELKPITQWHIYTTAPMVNYYHAQLLLKKILYRFSAFTLQMCMIYDPQLNVIYVYGVSCILAKTRMSSDANSITWVSVSICCVICILAKPGWVPIPTVSHVYCWVACYNSYCWVNVLLDSVALDEMGSRINELEQSINDLRAEIGVESSPSPVAPVKPKEEDLKKEDSA